MQDEPIDWLSVVIWIGILIFVVAVWVAIAWIGWELMKSIINMIRQPV